MNPDVTRKCDISICMRSGSGNSEYIMYSFEFCQGWETDLIEAGGDILIYYTYLLGVLGPCQENSDLHDYEVQKT